MVISVAAITGFMMLATCSRSLVPGRLQSISEILYEMIANMVRQNVGTEGRAYFPFIFSLFLFILFGNLLGMVPIGFTFTSHLVVTFFMAIVIFITVTIIGFVRHGAGFLRLFFPEGDRKSTRLNSSHVKISYAV